jgi:C4-dicarboxylate-specific signal transduction histidine kinase
VRWWFSLRTRVAVNLAAAVSLSFGLLAVAATAILPRAMSDAETAGLTNAANLIASALEACTDDNCVLSVVSRADKTGLTVEIQENWEPALAKTTPHILTASGSRAAQLIVQRQIGSRLVEVAAPLAPMIVRARSTLLSLLLVLAINGVAVIIFGTTLLERGVFSRLVPVAENMARIERFELDGPLGEKDDGDEIGRMAGTLRRIRERLRDDKQRTTDYIAELERTNRELRETREGLAQSDRLATVGRLAAGVAHEIGNPIAAILGYLDILRSSPGAPTAEYLERIDRETHRVDRIVRDMLDFARPQPLTIGPVSLAQVVASAERLVRPQPRWRSMTLSCDVPAELPNVAASEHHATQVLLNLLINAADACQGKGHITVRGTAAPDGAVILEVADDGPGFKPDHLSHVFDPFFTTKPPGEGVGLGLAISFRLMESFGGSIEAAQGQPKGAVFTLRFRRAA